MNCTIGVPVTRVRFLAETLASIRAQTVPATEVIVVDNVADGDVAAIVQASGLTNVRLSKRTERRGPIENWNALLEEVSADWFILLSDDDYFEPNHLEQLQTVIRSHPTVRVAHTRVRLVGEAGNMQGLTPLAAEWENRTDWLWHRVKGMRVQFLSDFVWHTATLRRVGGFTDLPVAWGSDDLTLFRVAREGGVAFGCVPSLNYRFHAHSISASYSAGLKLEAVRQLIEEYRRSLLEHGEETGLSADEQRQRGEVLRALDGYKERQQRYVLCQVPLRGWLKLVGAKHDVAFSTWLKALVERFRTRRRST